MQKAAAAMALRTAHSGIKITDYTHTHGFSDPGTPVLPQELDKSSSCLQMHSLVYCVWLDIPILDLVPATNCAL